MTAFSASTHGANPSKIVILSAAKDLSLSSKHMAPPPLGPHAMAVV